MALTITINDSWELGSRSGKKKLQVKDVTVVGDSFTTEILPAEIGLTTIIACTPGADSTNRTSSCVIQNKVVFAAGTTILEPNSTLRFLVFGLE